MIGQTRIPKPKLNDVFVRSNHDGAKEESCIMSLVTYPSGSWRAVLVTEAGWDHVTDAMELRLESEWRPADWELDETTRAYRPRGLVWNDDVGAYVALGADGKPAPAAKPAKPATSTRPPSPVA